MSYTDDDAHAQTVSISRESFARADLERVRVPRVDRRPCSWCGSRPGRFRYGWHHDGSQPGPLQGPAPCPLSRWHDGRAYCSVGCWRSGIS